MRFTWFQKLENASPRTSSSKLSDLFSSENTTQSEDELDSSTTSASSPGYNSNPPSGVLSPYGLSPWNPAAASPFSKSPWTQLPFFSGSSMATGLIGSLVREEGHVYSLAASGDLLFTGSDSKNIRVWKGSEEFAGFKSGSGLVKAIVIAGDKIFTGHQDGKIRVWSVSSKEPSVYKRVDTLPRLKQFLKSSINPSNYVRARRNKNVVWLKHYDAVSCLSYDEDPGILYSGSWDRTVKVWRVSDSKCLESIPAHDDAVNSVTAAGFDGFLFTGSADGTVKVWRREMANGGATTRHVLVQTLLELESAVTAVAVAPAMDGVVYCGCSDGAVHYWVWGKGRRRLDYGGALQGHRMAVLCLTVAGGLVASGSADNNITVWHRDRDGTHTRVVVLTGHEGPVKCLAIDDDWDDSVNAKKQGGRMRYVLYSGSLDRSVKIWRVSESHDLKQTTDKWEVRKGGQVPTSVSKENSRIELRQSMLQMDSSSRATSVVARDNRNSERLIQYARV